MTIVIATSYICPRTRAPLVRVDDLDADRDEYRPVGVAPIESLKKEYSGQWLLTADENIAYPILRNGVPLLIWPEAHTRLEHLAASQPVNGIYAEAYEEMDHYNLVAGQEAASISESGASAAVAMLFEGGPSVSEPGVDLTWLDSSYDAYSQMRAYRHVGSQEGRHVVQVGGKGIHAVKFLLQGAEMATVVSPMPGELECAISLARSFGVESRLAAVAAIGEELPLQAASVDTIFVAGSLHHMTIDAALNEFARVLKNGGRFAAYDPWKSPLYRIGTQVFGKREPSIYCRPVDAGRLSTLANLFPNSSIVISNPLLRYLLIACDRIGVRLPDRVSTRIVLAEGKITAVGLRTGRILGSCVALLATKG